MASYARAMSLRAALALPTSLLLARGSLTWPLGIADVPPGTAGVPTGIADVPPGIADGPPGLAEVPSGKADLAPRFAGVFLAYHAHY